MATLSYRGATQAAANDLVSQSYLSSLTGLNIAQSAIDTLISTGFLGYVTKAYVDQQDALNATKAFIDTGDASRLHVAQIGAVNGIAGLNSTGRIDVARVNQGSAQRYPKPFLSPTAYNSSAVSSTGTETQLFPPIAVADPGFTYKLMVFGTLDATTGTDGIFPVVRVRQGSATGQLVATGSGIGERYAGGVLTPFPGPINTTYTIPTWATNLDIITLGGGGSGGSGGGFGLYTYGAGGGAGGWGIGSGVAKGSASTLNVIAGGPGAASSVSGSGLTTVTGAAGANAGSQFVSTSPGASPGSQTVNGNLYQGGAGGAAGSPGAPGTAPGGGGGGGNYGIVGGYAGGAGAPGEVWIFAYASPNVPSGPVTIIPSPYNAQTSMTGATTLYVTLAPSSSATVTVSTVRPNLYVVPIPA